MNPRELGGALDEHWLYGAKFKTLPEIDIRVRSAGSYVFEPQSAYSVRKSLLRCTKRHCQRGASFIRVSLHRKRGKKDDDVSNGHGCGKDAVDLLHPLGPSAQRDRREDRKEQQRSEVPI